MKLILHVAGDHAVIFGNDGQSMAVGEQAC